MKWDLFKNRLKRESQQQEDAVDIDALWSAIEPDVDALNGKEDKRRRFFFWLFFGVGVALTAAWFALSNEETIADGAVAEKGTAVEEVSVLSKRGDVNNNLIAKAKETENKRDLLRVNSNVFQKNETVISINSAKVESGKTIENNEVVKINQLVNLNKNTNNSSVIALKSNPKRSLIVNVQTNLNEGSLVTEMQDSPTSPEKQKPNRKAEEKAAQNTVLIKETINRINISGLLVSMRNGLLPMKGDSLSDVPAFSPRYKEYTTFGKSAPAFSFTAGITGGLSFANRNLSQKVGEGSILLQNRNEYESSLETSHYGFFIGAKHKKYNLGITIGLQSTTIAERYTYKKEKVEKQMVFGVQVRRINLEGDTINIMGDVLETTTSTIDKNIYNSYRLLDIPVIVSYQYPLKKWNLGVEAGILVNLSLKTEGIVPNELLEVQGPLSRDQDIDNSKNDLFKSKVGLGYHFGLSIGGSITKKLGWKVAPMLRIYPSDFAGTTNQLSQRYVLYGVNGGVAYRF
ncbi:MAG: hypothetical protein ACI9XB_002516 [Gammaproteobacteria bacterium]|jgi:hypothetical protein